MVPLQSVSRDEYSDPSLTQAQKLYEGESWGSGCFSQSYFSFAKTSALTMKKLQKKMPTLAVIRHCPLLTFKGLLNFKYLLFYLLLFRYYLFVYLSKILTPVVFKRVSVQK